MNAHAVHLGLHRSAIRSAVQASIRAYPIETGGILIGWRDGSEIVVINAIEVKAATADSHSYELDFDNASAALEITMQSIGDARAGYVGSWHSHPALSPPSKVDTKTYRRVANVAKAPVGFVVVALGSRHEVSLYESVAVRVGRSVEVYHFPRRDIEIEEPKCG